jgi:ubiquinone/menaquinone biosynthesis C-methylase UbiE
MFTKKYWNERAKRSGNSLRTVMKRSLPDIINRYYDKKQKKVISSIVGSNNLLLEIGCGYGRLLQSLENPNDCIGVDFSKEMLIQAKNNLKSQLVLASGNKLPFKKNSFDRVLCVTVLIHIMTFDEIKQVLNEMDFVLRDDGILVIGEMGYFSYLVQKLLLKLGIAKHAIALNPFILSDTIKGMGYSIINPIKCGVYPNDVYFIAAKK